MERLSPVAQTNFLRAVLCLMAVTLIAGACSGSAASPAGSTATGNPDGTVPAAHLTVFAAASLTDAFKALADAYDTAHPGTGITISFDSSAALRTQIEQGATADILASADTTNPQKLVDEGQGIGPVTVFAGNLLTVVVPPGNPANIQTPADLAKPGVRFVAATATVPIQKYATQLIANLAKQPGYPADFVAAVTKNTVSKEQDVTSILAKIELGEGDAGIVYASDAAGAGSKVKTIDVPTAANVPARYGAVVTKASKNPAAAEAFLQWLTTPPAQAILARYGFLPPN
ncbi:MAG TPA: molybdate ABC transporter substrate-binding protein [Candidatus Saccharimonadales bacterium]|nr:molybdate ABC transporter substrate-binding protein [Candidatus Saccharimonadales bacterium]